MKDILILGCVRTEITNHVVSLPRGNEEIQSTGIDQKVGGNGFACARIMQMFNFPYILAGPVGTGVYGEFVRTECAKYNIDLACASSETDGCAYELADGSGHRSVMIVPGAEYSFDREYLQYLDLDELSSVIIFSEMISGEDGLDLLEAAGEFDKPIIVVLNGDASELDQTARKALLALGPQLILYDSDLYYLNGEADVSMDQAVKNIYTETRSPLYVLRQDRGCYRFESNEGKMFQTEGDINASLFADFLVAAEMADADHAAAVIYALTSMKECMKYNLNEESREKARQRLIEVIQHQ